MIFKPLHKSEYGGGDGCVVGCCAIFILIVCVGGGYLVFCDAGWIK